MGISQLSPQGDKKETDTCWAISLGNQRFTEGFLISKHRYLRAMMFSNNSGPRDHPSLSSDVGRERLGPDR
jgi:hypothetical protein